MTRALRFDPAASDELLSARDWYAREAGPGVAAEFVEAFWRLTDRLLGGQRLRPASVSETPAVRDDKPRCGAFGIAMRGFRYGVVYEVRDDVLVVIAVAHRKRRPSYWRSRLR